MIRSRTAFTLIELIVVIAIIAVIAAIAIPNLQKAREDANRISCMARLHSLRIAYSFYEMENYGGHFPTEGPTNGHNFGALCPRYISVTSFDCPAATTPEAEFIEATGEVLYEDYFQDNVIPEMANNMRIIAADAPEGGVHHPGGSNVLFKDGHVEFCETAGDTGAVPNLYLPSPGIDSDIYTIQDPMQPRHMDDAVLDWEP